MSKQQKIGRWEVLKPLGKGGQGQVSLVRRPARIQERDEAVQEIMAAGLWIDLLAINSFVGFEVDDRSRVSVSRVALLHRRQAPGISPRVDGDVIQSEGVLEHPACQ